MAHDDRRIALGSYQNCRAGMRRSTFGPESIGAGAPLKAGVEYHPFPMAPDASRTLTLIAGDSERRGV